MRAALLAVVLAAGLDAGFAGNLRIKRDGALLLPDGGELWSADGGFRFEFVGPQPSFLAWRPIPQNVTITCLDNRPDAGPGCISGAVFVGDFSRPKVRIDSDGGVLHVYAGPGVVVHRVDGGW